MQNYNIILSGGNGFLGKEIIRYFNQKKIKISKIDIKKTFFEKLDEKKINNFLEKKFDKKKKNIFIHLGWGLISDPFSSYHKVNYLKSKLIFKFCKIKKFEKIIFCGSINEYGNKKGGLKESFRPKKFIGLYAKYKFLTTNYGLKHINNFFSIRPSYIYGHRQRKGTLIDLLLKSIKLKKKIKMTNCKIYRDYIFVEDVASAFYEIAFSNAPAGIYNVGSGKLITLKKLIKEITKKSNFNSKYLAFGKLVNKEKNQPKSFMITKKIKRYSSWSLINTLEDGIIKILKYHKINSNN